MDFRCLIKRKLFPIHRNFARSHVNYNNKSHNNNSSSDLKEIEFDDANDIAFGPNFCIILLYFEQDREIKTEFCAISPI